jgi:HSP20 family protein
LAPSTFFFCDTRALYLDTACSVSRREIALGTQSALVVINIEPKYFIWRVAMARGSQQQDDLLMGDDITAAFLSDDDTQTDEQPVNDQPVPEEEDWTDDEPVAGQLAVDVYETREKLVVKGRVAGVNKSELDVSISDNTLSIRGTLSAGNEDGVENYFLQECYWGEFSRSLVLPVPVKEDEIEAVLKDGVLTISFAKVKQDTVKKIEVL